MWSLTCCWNASRFPGLRPAFFALAEQARLHAYLCATTVTTVDYLLMQALPGYRAREALHRLLELFGIAPVNRSVIEEALKSRMDDFEDAVLAYAGDLVDVDAVVTRNPRDFRYAPVRALDPAEVISGVSGSGDTG